MFKACFANQPYAEGILFSNLKHISMFVRLTYFSLAPERAKEITKLYHEEVAPVIHGQPGVIDVKLFEPVQSDDEFISCTIWERESDTKAFETSEVYPKLFGKIKAATSKPPHQKYYNLE